jgi:hypothetical protein
MLRSAQGQMRHRRISPAHLQQAVALGIQRPFELQHVPILLWVDVLIRKVHHQTLQRKLQSPHSHAQEAGSPVVKVQVIMLMSVFV